MTEAEKVEARFETMEAYIWKRHNTVVHYIAMQSLLGLFEETDRMQGGVRGCGGGNRQALIWQGQGIIRRRGKRRTRISWNITGGGKM